MAEPTFQQLTEQVQRLTQRVAALERELGTRSEPETATVPSVQPEPTPPKFAAAAVSLESNLGLRWVNRIGAVTLILGIAFFFRYAVENNWIGETARVLLGAGAGALLIAGGEFGFRLRQRIFAQGISGAGLASLYLSCYAAFDAYHLISVWPAFVVLAGITGLAALLAIRYSAEAIAVLALFGGLLAPWLLQSLTGNEWIVPIYVAVLDAAFLALAHRGGWRKCEWAALAGTVVFTGNMADDPRRVLLPIYYAMFATRPNRMLFAASHALLLGRATFLPHRPSTYLPEILALCAGGVAVVRWRGWNRLLTFLVTAAGLSWWIAGGELPIEPALTGLAFLFVLFLFALTERAVKAPGEMDARELAAFPLSAALFFAGCYVRLAGWANSWAALLALGLAWLYLGLAYKLARVPRTVTAGIAAAFMAVAVPIEFRAFRITLAWAAEGAALAWIGARRNSRAAEWFGSVVLLAAVFRFFTTDVALPFRMVTSVGLALALFATALWSRGLRVLQPVAGAVGHLVLLAGIAFEVVDQAGKTNAASVTISILFAAYAVALIAVGTATNTAGNRYTGLTLIAAVVVKLYLVDVWQFGVVYRFIAFATLGALLLATSFLYSRYRDRIASWLTSPGVSEVHPPTPPE